MKIKVQKLMINLPAKRKPSAAIQTDPAIPLSLHLGHRSRIHGCRKADVEFQVQASKMDLWRMAWNRPSWHAIHAVNLNGAFLGCQARSPCDESTRHRLDYRHLLPIKTRGHSLDNHLCRFQDGKLRIRNASLLTLIGMCAVKKVA